MYLAQTNLEVDTTVVYDYAGNIGPVRVYLTKKVENSSTQIVVVDSFRMYGRNCNIFELTKERKARMTKIEKQFVIKLKEKDLFFMQTNGLTPDINAACTYMFQDAVDALKLLEVNRHPLAFQVAIKLKADFI